MRKKLVEGLKIKGIRDEKVLAAIGRVPRQLFMESSFLSFAYKDQAFPIGAGQTISQPFTVAFQTWLLQVEKNDRILEIGTGSGYQAAVLCEMGIDLYSIERQSELYKKCSQMLPSMGYAKINLFLGDGYEGLPESAPFDAVLVTAGAEEIPAKLLLQIKIGGVMVVPIGSKVQIMTRIRRLNEEEFEQEEFGECAFVPMLNGIHP